MKRAVPFLFALLPAAPLALAQNPAAPTTPATPAAPADAEFKRPAYQVLRYNEDWKVLRDASPELKDDFFDPIKYVPFSEDGSIWASFGGQIRERWEVWDGFNFGAGAPKDAQGFLLTRLLFHTDIHVGPNLRFFFEGKSSHSTERDLLGGTRNLDVDEMDLQNGFVDLTLPFDKSSLTFRVGRQEILFGKQRIVGPLDWTNTRRTFDGVSGIFKFDSWTITPFWVRPVAIEKYDFNEFADDQDFSGIYASGKLPGTDIGLELFWLYLDKDATTFNGLTDVATGFNGTTGAEERHTLGGRLLGKIPNTGFDYEVEGAYQTGELGDNDIDAWMISTQLGHTFAQTAGTPRIFGGFDYASGDHSAGGDVQTYNQLFPTGHLYLGWIDQIGRQNIIAASTGVSVKPLKNLTIDLQGHYFWRADTDDAGYNVGGGVFRAPGTDLSSDIGAEIDLLVKYQFDRHTDILLGYSHFFPGEYIKDSGRSNDIDFFYVGFQFTF